jgi:hypothetical protein
MLPLSSTPKKGDRAMPDRANALTAAAGEHYVAYRLSRMGHLVGLTRGGSPSVDLMVGHPEKGTPVSIQVKTSESAHRYHGRGDKKKQYWSWRVGEKAASLRDNPMFYAFVSLEENQKRNPICRTLIVPSRDVPGLVAEEGKGQFWFNTPEIDMDKEPEWQEQWQLITERLTGGK